VVALLYVMLLIGMVGASAVFGWLLADYTHLRLVQVIQGAAFLTFVFNVIALWRQEPRNPDRGRMPATAPPFRVVWQRFSAPASTRRLLWTIGLGTAAFSMQDVLLEPYGGEILGMPIGATSLLTAFWATGALFAFGLAARRLRVGADPLRVAASGLLVGLIAFAAVVLADPLGSPLLFKVGALLIGFGGGLFSVGTLLAAMALERTDNGLALGAWGAVQATAAGLAIAAGGALCDLIGGYAELGALGPALTSKVSGYMFVYHLELGLLFAALVAIGPLVRLSVAPKLVAERLGLADMPG
jgi:BCD family chlorophyll transporter-like MFS transporter